MIVTNIPQVPGYEIKEHFGLVSGSTVRSRNVGVNFLAGFKQLIGGEIESYTELLNHARDEALGRMLTHAMQKGANAVINVRFATSEPVGGVAEIYVYGTAVKV